MCICVLITVYCMIAIVEAFRKDDKLIIWGLHKPNKSFLLLKALLNIASLLIRYEIISDSRVYAIPYSYCMVFMCVLILCWIHHAIV